MHNLSENNRKHCLGSILEDTNTNKSKVSTSKAPQPFHS